MTKDQFQRETQEFMTRDEQEAIAKAAAYNALGVDGETIVPAKFGDDWCVMLKGAFDFAREFGLAVLALRGHEVPLVADDDKRLTLFERHPGETAILVEHALHRIDQQHRDIAAADGFDRA